MVLSLVIRADRNVISSIVFCLHPLALLFQVEVEFANGSAFKLSAEFLRINSPAVDGKIRSIGGEKVTSLFQIDSRSVDSFLMMLTLLMILLI